MFSFQLTYLFYTILSPSFLLSFISIHSVICPFLSFFHYYSLNSPFPHSWPLSLLPFPHLLFTWVKLCLSLSLPLFIFSFLFFYYYTLNFPLSQPWPLFLLSYPHLFSKWVKLSLSPLPFLFFHYCSLISPFPQAWPTLLSFPHLFSSGSSIVCSGSVLWRQCAVKS